MIIRAILAALLIQGIAFAAHPDDAVCRVAIRYGDQGSLGSGTLVVIEEGLFTILTCAHMFEDRQADYVLCTFPSTGKKYLALPLRIDRELDLSLLLIADPKIKAVTVTCNGSDGELRKGGLGGLEGNLRMLRGHRIGRAFSGGQQCIIVGGDEVRQGDSGGPIFNKQGELVSVLWGEGEGEIGDTYGTSNQQVYNFCYTTIGKGNTSVPSNDDGVRRDSVAEPDTRAVIVLEEPSRQAGSECSDGSCKRNTKKRQRSPKGFKFLRK